MTFVSREMRAGRVFAGAAIVVTSIALAPGSAMAQATATEKAREAGRETTQETKEAVRDSGNAVTDSWITMKVHAQFVPEDALEGSDIDVETKKGVVTLMGTVPTAAGRDRAVQIAKTTDGVKNVSNQLRVAAAERNDVAGATGAAAREGARETGATARDAGRGVSDGWLTSKIYADMIDEDALEGSDIDVDVNGGVATLTGTVATAAGSARAAEVAKGIDGVKSVRNNLKVAARK
jgi:hyperosmotically inducible periplasmic protein